MDEGDRHDPVAVIPFPVGARVKISGLKKRADLNGKLGYVLAPDDEQKAIHMENGRVKVRADGVAGKPLSIRPENLVKVTVVSTVSDIDWSIMDSPPFGVIPPPECPTPKRS